MRQLFHRRWNVIAPVTLIALPVVLVGVGIVAMVVQRSPYATQVGRMPDQPVPFSHQHHAGELGIDCRFCHQSVETSAYAGMPSTEVCMKCHSQIWPRSQMLEPVRESYDTATPIHWTRVHDLPDHAYFDHSIHIAKGVGCSTCHGRVDRMPLMAKAQSLHMQWCLDCHRDPARYLRPADHIFDMAWTPHPPQSAVARELMNEYRTNTTGMTNCSVCHR